tara:strand:+ start:726 stop:1334 length:609 start_codon:yes stop_codon:yes gene_type:complete
MGTINVNAIDKESGSTLTLGTSGTTVDIPSGATIDATGATVTGFGGDNTPAFQARLSADQSISDDTYTLIECDTEDFDTDSAYDNTTNFDFTVPVGEGGKYFVYGHLGIYGSGGYDSVKSIHFQCRVNAETSSTASIHHSLAYHNSWNYMCDLSIQGILTLSAGDTVKWYAYGDEASGNNMVIEAKAGDGNNIVGAYKLIGL